MLCNSGRHCLEAIAQTSVYTSTVVSRIRLTEQRRADYVADCGHIQMI